HYCLVHDCALLFASGNDAVRAPQLLYFFFQAEDGIRDATVTGVQTCALPISCHGEQPHDPSHDEPRGQERTSLLPLEPLRPETRSEERRVGKEWRPRGSPHA